MSENNKRKLLLIVGPTCTGKTTLEEKLFKSGLFVSVRIYTTREPRKVEADHYRFVYKDTFDAMVKEGKFFYHMPTNEGTFYGYEYMKNLGTNVVSFISEENAKGFLEKVGSELDISIVRLTAAEEDIKRCYEERGMDEEIIKLRTDMEYKLFEDIPTFNREDSYDGILALFNKDMENVCKRRL